MRLQSNQEYSSQCVNLMSPRSMAMRQTSTPCSILSIDGTVNWQSFVHDNHAFMLISVWNGWGNKTLFIYVKLKINKICNSKQRLTIFSKFLIMFTLRRQIYLDCITHYYNQSSSWYVRMLLWNEFLVITNVCFSKFMYIMYSFNIVILLYIKVIYRIFYNNLLHMDVSHPGFWTALRDSISNHHSLISEPITCPTYQ